MKKSDLKPIPREMHHNRPFLGSTSFSRPPAHLCEPPTGPRAPVQDGEEEGGDISRNRKEGVWIASTLRGVSVPALPPHLSTFRQRRAWPFLHSR